MKIFVAFLAIAIAVDAYRYDGFHVYQLDPLVNEQQVALIKNVVDQDERLKQVIMINDHIVQGVPLEVAVNPVTVDRFKDLMTENGITITLMNSDLQQTFDLNMVAGRMSKEKYGDDISLYEHDAYLTYDEQVAWMQAAVAASPIASLVNAGRSYENQIMYVLTINANNNALPALWIDSGIHAREWISQATTLYIIDEILTGNSVDAQYLRANFRWYFMPNVNPDGYVYSWTDDNMWRKTRSPNAGSLCIGTDANRNWDSNWCGEGASTNPCSDTYCGSRAFSEVETQNARDYMISIKDITNVMISIHAYSQYWLIPWGGYPYKPADYDELLRVGNLARDAIFNTNGLIFIVGTPPDILYVATGGTLDWAKESNEMKYTYSPELRPQNTGGSFQIPPSNIVPSGMEIFNAVNAVARNAQHKL